MHQLTLREKIGYGLGDTACGVIWYSTIMLLTYFYTDVFGIPPAVMGTLFLASRIIDAFTDPLMGALVDRNRSKYGQFRPFLLWGAVPFLLATMATFYTPDFNETGKIIYASISYILLTLVYTFVNVPYCAMPGALTCDPQERHSLQSWRFFCAAGGSLLVSGVALTLVGVFGGTEELDVVGEVKVIDEKFGYFMSMTTMGIIGMALLLISFANTKERYHFEKKDNAQLREDLKLLLKNTQWRIICLFKIMTASSAVIRGGTAIYFVKYVMEHPDLATEFLFYGSIASMLGSLLSANLLKKFDRVQAFKVIIIIYSILSLALFFAPPSFVPLMFGLNIVFLFIMNITTPLQWLMASDVIDHEESKSGRRLDGLVFSTYLFSIKLGLALGGALIGWALAIANYDGNLSQQPEEAISVIKILFCIVPVIFNGVLLFLLSIYKLNNKTVNSIAEELALKRKNREDNY